MNGSSNRAVICGGNVILSEINATLVPLKSYFTSPAHMLRLGSVIVSFAYAMKMHQIALRKYLSDVEQAFGRDIRSRSSNASETDINAALGNAVECARASTFDHTIIVVEAGDAFTNSIGKELLPKYLDLVSLVDSIDVLLQIHLNLVSILGANRGIEGGVERGIEGGVEGGVEQPVFCSRKRLGNVAYGVFLLVIIGIPVVAIKFK